MTLIELVVAITVIGIAITSVLGVLSSVAIRSGEAMIREEATSIASAYLNEITLKAYQHDGVENGRINFDDVDDFATIQNAAVSDQFGTPVPGLNQFTVTVTIISNGPTLGQAANTVPVGKVKLIMVTVNHTSGLSVTLSGYKTEHP